MFFFCTTQDASSYVYVAEIFPTHSTLPHIKQNLTSVRPKGVALSVSGLFISTLIFVSAAPSAFSGIGWGYYIILAALSIIGALCEWFFWPVSRQMLEAADFDQETRGITLEGVAAKFGDRTAHSLDGVTLEKEWAGLQIEKQHTEERDVSVV